MRIKGITEHDLRQAVNTASKEYDNNIVFKREPERIGNFLHFTLTVNKSADPGGRRSHSGRCIAAACWHAHRDVMKEIFKRAPDALLITAMARYDGKQDFYYSFPGTGESNIGSMVFPLQMQDACDCCE